MTRNNTNSTSSKDMYNNTFQILNPAKMAIQLQSLLYLVQERIGEKPELTEIKKICEGFNAEKERLILIDKKNQGALPNKKKTNSTKTSFIEIAVEDVEELKSELEAPISPSTSDKNLKKKLPMEFIEKMLMSFDEAAPINHKSKPKMIFIEELLKEFNVGNPVPQTTPNSTPENKHEEGPKCEYIMSAPIKKKIEDMSRLALSKLVGAYENLLKLTGPQTLMVRMILMKTPLENLAKQNINLVSMFMQNLSKNMHEEKVEQSA